MLTRVGTVAVAFDLDGTLMNHDQAARDAVTEWVAARGWTPPSNAGDEWLHLEREHFAPFAAGRITFHEQRRRRLRDFLPLVQAEARGDSDLDDLFAEYVAIYEKSWVAYDDAPLALDELSSRGLTLAVLTNGQREQQVAKLARIGLLSRFALVLASSELPAGKPDPRAFAALCDRLGHPARDVVFVGDDLTADVAGSLAAGLRPIHVDRDLSGGRPEGIAGISTLRELPRLLS